MTLTVATWLATGLGVYALLGLLFTIPFALVGAGRIDPVAKEGTWGFRLLLVPGAIALWPLLAKRWLGGVGAPPEENNPHRRAAREANR